MTNIRTAFFFPASFVAEGRSADDYLHNSTYGNGMLAPDGWTDEALECLEAHVCPPAAHRRPSQQSNNIEQPEWLPKPDTTWSEYDVTTMIRRVVGAATAKAWTIGWFSDEISARHFYEDLRYLLAQRALGITPSLLAKWGYGWAYNQSAPDSPTPAPRPASDIPVSHRDIDQRVKGDIDSTLTTKWHSLLPTSIADRKDILFSDTASEWGTAYTQPATLFINLFFFRGEEGHIPLERLRQATRLLTLLASLHNPDSPDLGIGIINLPALLISLGLPYDSPEARATGQAVTSLITATAVATSAQIAAFTGMSPAFKAERDNSLRTLRNLARASFGDLRDYEKLSVIPAALVLGDCPDLTLVSTAQQTWREALELATTHGLRHIRHTSLLVKEEDHLVMSSLSKGGDYIDVKSAIVVSSGRTALAEALKITGATPASLRAVILHLKGHGTLAQAPHINPASLGAKGFDEGMLKRLEDYLPHTHDLRYAATPWVIGMDGCRRLGLNDYQMDDVGFDLLDHLGYTADQIMAANAYIYGHPDLSTMSGLAPDQRALFAPPLSPTAQLRMAASLQSGTNGIVPLTLKVGIEGGVTSPAAETFIMTAWRLGLKTLSLQGSETPVTTVATFAPRGTASVLPPHRPSNLLAKKAAKRRASLSKTKADTHSHPPSNGKSVRT